MCLEAHLGKNVSCSKGLVDLNPTTTILCPTRGRPRQLGTMISSALLRAASPQDLVFRFYIDLDDRSYDDFPFNQFKCKIFVHHGPRISLSAAFNFLATNSNTDFLFWSGDDVEFKTDNWEVMLQEPLQRLPDRLGVSHADDLANYSQIYATIGMAHKSWFEALGFLFTPHLQDNGIDFWISNVARCIKRLYFVPEVKIDHLQFRQGKSEEDATYTDRRNAHDLYDIASIYWKLRDQRRRESLILLRRTNSKSIPWEFRYFLARFLHFFSARRLQPSELSNKQIRLISLSNVEILRKFIAKIIPLFRQRPLS